MGKNESIVRKNPNGKKYVVNKRSVTGVKDAMKDVKEAFKGRAERKKSGKGGGK